MSIITTTVLAATAAWVGFSAFSVFTHKPWVVDNFVDYRVPRFLWVWLGVAKALGAVGLVVGLWVPAIGVAAAIGLNAHAYAHIPFPLLYLVPVVAAGLMTATA